jgi:RHS repeat-associated protein
VGSNSAIVGYAGYGWQSHGVLSLTLYRAYDGELGRWISEDPIGLAGGLNLYSYAENSPVRFTDPLGLAFWICNRAAWRGWIIEGWGAGGITAISGTIGISSVAAEVRASSAARAGQVSIRAGALRVATSTRNASWDVAAGRPTCIPGSPATVIPQSTGALRPSASRILVHLVGAWGSDVNHAANS